MKAGGDTDRRIALIGFDQTIEVCIEVYVRLHPRLRGGVCLQKATVEAALKNFHSKIEFLENNLGENLGVSPEAIVWYHSLRNELYHAGNGMVPETHVLRGAREAAARVFAAAFGQEFASEVADEEIQAIDPQEPITASTRDPRMNFLSYFLQLERLVRERQTAGRNSDALHCKEGTRAWPAQEDKRPYRQQLPSLASAFVQTWPSAGSEIGLLQRLTRLRNEIVHGIADGTSATDFDGATTEIQDLLQRLQGSDEAHADG